jgi:signal transduction histidine kinase
MRLGIRYQFLVPLVLLLLGLVGVCTWTALDSARAAERRVAGQMNRIIHMMGEAGFALSPHVLEQMKELSGAEFLLIDASGQRTATFRGSVGELPAIGPAGTEPSLGQRIDVDGRRYLCRGVLLRPPNPNPGARLYILYPESLRDEAVWQAVRPTLILGASAGIAAVALTVLSAGGVVRRLRELERRTRQVAAGDFNPVPLPHPNDELRDLARSVNEMAAKLAAMQEAIAGSERDRLLGQVSSGLAHQLRNAVTGAKLSLQLHGESCPGGDREALAVAERQLSRMASDLQRFFDLGRAGTRREPCDLGDILDDAVALVRPQCKHTHTELDWERPAEAVRLMGDAGQLSHLVLNIVTNAIEAAGAGGRVALKLLVEGNRGVIEVTDTGTGPPPGIRARLFEPFVTGKPEGVGLGLAVARRIAEAHGGGIDWRRNDDTKTCFWIELPCEGKA